MRFSVVRLHDSGKLTTCRITEQESGWTVVRNFGTGLADELKGQLTEAAKVIIFSGNQAGWKDEYAQRDTEIQAEVERAATEYLEGLA